jgi:hypothetical protein
MSGLGISAWLDKMDTASAPSKRRKNYFDWKKKGEAHIWLHIRSEFEVLWIHNFQIPDEIDERDEVTGEKTGNKTKILRFTRHISLDSHKVNLDQNFRDPEDNPQTPPLHDPFLLLKEWIYRQVKSGRMASDQQVFEWHDPKTRSSFGSYAGIMCGIVKSKDFKQKLGSRRTGILVFIDDDDIKSGLKLDTNVPWGVMKGMTETIIQERKSKGDEAGDPMISPYCFCWEYNKNARLAEMYKVFRYDRAQYTQEIADLMALDPIDINEYRTVNPTAERIKIRAAFEAAAKIDLPYDQLFSEDPRERATLLRGNVTAMPIISAPRVPVAPGPKAPAHVPAIVQPATTAPVAAVTTSPKAPARRKKVEQPPPPPIESFACEDCEAQGVTTMLEARPGTVKCPVCKATYQIDGDENPSTPPMTQSVPSTRSIPSPAQVAATNAKIDTSPKCWACGTILVPGSSTCPSCSVEASDDVPEAWG